ncbi:MAG: ankyrin repeat domain-containing protein, partial [Treponema sp.]|nr:ankyrin repeat domain-containing protein [Treponema sp.]
MKKSPFLSAPMGVFAVLILLTFGCKTTEPPTIWQMLAAQDEKAMEFFKGKVDVNATDDEGKTPLHYAAENNDAQLAAFFVSIGAKPNAEDNLGRTPLNISMANANSEVARILVLGGADIHRTITFIEEREDEEPIRTTTTTAAFALSKGAGFFRSILTPASVESVDNTNRTVLHMASIAGDLQSVQNVLTVLSTPALIGKTDRQNKNALDYALDRADSINHMLIAEQLILNGAFSDNPVFNYFGPAARSANYNIRRNEGLTPIHYAVMNNHIGLITFLLGKNININIKSTSGATALHEAMRIGNMQIIRMLVEAGADVNARDANNNTPLHTGIPANVHLEAASLLLSKEANPNLRDDHGDTPLHIAIILNRPLDVISVFIDNGSDIHIRNIQGKTPLYIAVQERRTSLIPTLLENGSEIFAADNSGVTPFDIAAKANDATFNLLIVPETVNQRDSAGNTMLHAAVTNRA